MAKPKPAPVLPKSKSAILLPYQQNWVRDQSILKVIEKSRRTGITWAEASDNVLTAAAAKSAGGMNVYYIGYNKDMAVEYIQTAAMWARNFNVAAGEVSEGFWDEGDADKNILAYTIKFPNSGFRIVALSSRPSNLRGRQGVIVIDEAAFHPELAELLKAALAMQIWGGRVHVISTHNGVDNPFNELINDIRGGRRAGAAVHRVTLTYALYDGLFKRICEVAHKPHSEQAQIEWVETLYSTYGDAAAEELDCIPALSSGAWLSRGLIESRINKTTPILRWECKDEFALMSDYARAGECLEWCQAMLDPVIKSLLGIQVVLGVDFARNGDLSVFIPLALDTALVRRVACAIELRNIPFRQQEQILFYLADRLGRFHGAALDARGNGQYLAEVAMQRYGASLIQPIMLSEGWYRDNMPPLKAALEDGNLIDLPDDVDFMADLRAVKMVRGVPRLPDTRAIGRDGNKRHGDAAIALAMAFYASRELNTGPVIAASRRPNDTNSILGGYFE